MARGMQGLAKFHTANDTLLAIFFIPQSFPNLLLQSDCCVFMHATNLSCAGFRQSANLRSQTAHSLGGEDLYARLDSWTFTWAKRN
jgi:hypothetical protein